MADVATMVVKISADIASLTSGLDKAEKAVLKSAQAMNELGNKLSLFVTAPAIAAGVAMAKFAADAEASANRMTRTFGPAASQMQGFIANLRDTVPETTSALDQMASQAKVLADNLGLTAPAAVQVSQGLLKLAGDMAAFNGESSIQPALEALQKGLAGQTRGLAQYGIVIKEADVLREAYKEGLISSGQQLTETGRAIASYNLEMQRSTAIQGEAARTVGDAQRQFAFLKSDLGELGEKIGALLLPAVVTLATGFKDLLQWISSLPRWVDEVAIGMIALAATVGPLLKLIAVITEIRTLFMALSAVGWIAELTNPIGLAIAGFAALGAAIYWVYQKFEQLHGEVGASQQKAGSSVGASNVTDLYKQLGKGAAGSSALGMASGSPMEQLQQHVSSVVEAYQYAAATGGNLTSVFREADSLSARVLHQVKGMGDAFGDNAKKLRDMVMQLRAVTTFQALQGLGLADDSLSWPIDTHQPDAKQLVSAGALTQAYGQRTDALSQALDSAISRGGDLAGIFAQLRDLNNQALDTLSQIPDKLSAAGVAAQSVVDKLRPFMQANHALGFPSIGSSQPFTFNAPAAATVQASKDQQDYAQSLALRKALLAMPDYFDAANEAAVALAQGQRSAVHDLNASWQELKQGIEAINNGTANYAAALASATTALYNDVSNLINSTLTSTAASTGNGTGASIGGDVLGSIGGSLGGPFGQEIGQVVGSVVGGGLQELGKRLFGIHGKDETAIERDAVTKANTQALQQLTLRMQGFQVNAGNTVAASQALGAFFQNSAAVAQLTNNQTHKGGFLGVQTKGDLQSQIDALTPTLTKFGLTFTQLEAIVQNSGLNIFDKDGRIVGSALQQLTTGLLQAAQAAFTLTNSFQSFLNIDQLIASAKGQNTGVNTNLSSYNSAVDAFLETLKGSPLIAGAPTGAAADTAAGMAWWRQLILNLEEQEKATGKLDPALMGLFQGITDANSAFSAIIDPLNAMTNAVAGATAVFTNLPSGFRAAQAAYDLYLSSPIQSVPRTLSTSGPLPRGYDPKVGTTGTTGSASGAPTTVYQIDTVNVTSSATTIDGLTADIQRQVNRGGTPKAALAIKRLSGLVT